METYLNVIDGKLVLLTPVKPQAPKRVKTAPALSVLLVNNTKRPKANN